MDNNLKFDNWLPLESNSDTLNNYLATLGVNNEIINFVDVLTFEKEYLVPGSVGALFVYPDSKPINNYFFNKGETMFEKPISPSTYYMKQIAENACGTIAILHLIGNILSDYPFVLQEESFVQQFLSNTLHMNPEERAEYLKNCKLEVKKKDGQVKTLQEAHKDVAKEGQAEEIQLKAGHHFIGFIWKEGCVYELDGRKKGPINYGECEQFMFLEKVTEICQQHYINQDMKEIGFNLMALQIGF